VCGEFAFHARTTVTFDGAETKIDGGLVGVFPGTSITGSSDADITSAESADLTDSVLVAYSEAMAVGADETMAIEMGGLTFTPGTYRSGSAINIAHGTEVTLDGNNEDNPVFLFQAGSTLVTAADTTFILKNRAKA
jgi:hypothetical protein